MLQEIFMWILYLHKNYEHSEVALEFFSDHGKIRATKILINAEIHVTVYTQICSTHVSWTRPTEYKCVISYKQVWTESRLKPLNWSFNIVYNLEYYMCWLKPYLSDISLVC